MTTAGLAVPSIPPRTKMLRAALGSALRQTRPFDQISIAVDLDHRGAAVTRNRAWRALDTDYVFFLDDDDQLYPNHVEVLLNAAVEHEADMAFSWFDCTTVDPFPPTHFTDPWDPANPRQTTITCCWRRDALEKIGGFPEEFDDDEDGGGNRAGEDYLAVLKLNEWGKIVHLPERTWLWNHHGANTSGLASRWA